jgi:hypothetical protein
MGFEIRIGPNMNVSGGEVGQAQALSLELAFNGLHDFLSRQCGDCYEFCLLTCRALAGGSNSEALGPSLSIQTQPGLSLPKYLAVAREAAEDQAFPQVCGSGEPRSQLAQQG